MGIQNQMPEERILNLFRGDLVFDLGHSITESLISWEPESSVEAGIPAGRLPAVSEPQEGTGQRTFLCRVGMGPEELGSATESWRDLAGSPSSWHWERTSSPAPLHPIPCQKQAQTSLTGSRECRKCEKQGREVFLAMPSPLLLT